MKYSNDYISFIKNFIQFYMQSFDKNIFFNYTWVSELVYVFNELADNYIVSRYILESFSSKNFQLKNFKTFISYEDIFTIPLFILI